MKLTNKQICKLLAQSITNGTDIKVRIGCKDVIMADSYRYGTPTVGFLDEDFDILYIMDEDGNDLLTTDWCDEVNDIEL